MTDSKFLQVAKRAASEAGKVVKKYQGREHIYKQKSHKHDFATEADLESEKTIIKIIKKTFPEHSILAEESGREDKNSEYVWAIDPIDGTLAFVGGMPYYAVSIGLLKDGIPQVGVINVVGRNEMFWAEKDGGAFLNSKPIQVSDRNKINVSYLVLDIGARDRSIRIKRHLMPFLEEARAIYMMGGAAFELAYAACGFIDACILEAHPWDFAAGAVILEEAGGKVTDFEGNPVDFTKDRINLIGSNGSIHQEFLDILNKK